jgi:membrane-bound lytic murein transglycosylase D
MGQQPRLLRRLYGKRSLHVWFGGVIIQSLLLWGLMPPAVVLSSEELFPIPDALRPNVRFWKKTFAEVEVTGGILHDMHDLSIIYETLEQLPSNSQERQSTISGYREYYQSILATLAEGKRQDLSSDEARVLAMFPGKDRSEVFEVAAANIRFQGGMRERFMRGIIRSGIYAWHYSFWHLQARNRAHFLFFWSTAGINVPTPC